MAAEAGRLAVRRWERLAALTGVVAVVLWVVGVAIVDGTTDVPDEEAPPAAYVEYYDDDGSAILGGGFVFILGSLFFLWFVGTLRARLAAAEGDPGRLAGTAFGAGVATALCTLLLPAPDMTAALRDEGELSGEAAQTFNNMADIFFIGAEFTAAAFLIAVGLLAVRRLGLPAWLGWVGLLVALVLLIAPIGWAGLLFGFPAWTLVTSVLLFLRPAPSPA